jgi:hypothetical protein
MDSMCFHVFPSQTGRIGGCGAKFRLYNGVTVRCFDTFISTRQRRHRGRRANRRCDLSQAGQPRIAAEAAVAAAPAMGRERVRRNNYAGMLRLSAFQSGAAQERKRGECDHDPAWRFASAW